MNIGLSVRAVVKICFTENRQGVKNMGTVLSAFRPTFGEEEVFS